MDSDPMNTMQANQDFYGEEVAKSVTWHESSWDYMLLAEGKTAQKQAGLKTAAVKAWQNFTNEETQHLVMSLSSRL